MSHLTAAEFVDLLEGNLDAQRARHADACAMCRRQIDDLRSALLSGLAAEQPEPSPLFWENFSARVREGIDAAPQSGRRRWLPWILAPRMFTAGAAVAALVLVGVFSRVDLTPPLDNGELAYAPPQAGSTTAAEAADAGASELDPEEAWAAVSAIVEKVAWEDARDAGFAAAPGEAERAISTLTDVERARLAALLEAELKKTGD